MLADWSEQILNPDFITALAGLVTAITALVVALKAHEAIRGNNGTTSPGARPVPASLPASGAVPYSIQEGRGTPIAGPFPEPPASGQTSPGPAEHQ